MRSLIAMTLLYAALSSQAYALTWEEARHLLLRTGFNTDKPSIERLLPLSRPAAVDLLLQGVKRTANTPPPAWVTQRPDGRGMHAMTDEQRKQIRRRRIQWIRQLQAWWFEEMLHTDSPLTEKMTLFWHNHFTSGFHKVRWPPFLYRQNTLLRDHALGNFTALLQAVAKDPAMLIYLDSAQNRKAQPNENFARELMELFTLGEGHYTEQDIKAAAQAFTGWSVDRKTGQYRFNMRQHDAGDKTFFGQSGPFNGDDILRLLLLQPRTAEWIAEKFWREFVSPQPLTKDIQALAAVFRNNRYEIKPLLRAVLLSEPFWREDHRGALIKSPVEFVVGTVRALNMHVHDYQMLAQIAQKLGQEVFNPPNVKGWPGGEAWITADTLLLRNTLVNRVLRVSDHAMAGRDVADRAVADLAGAPPLLRRVRRSTQGAGRGASSMAPAAQGYEGVGSDALSRLWLALNPVQVSVARGPAAVLEVMTDPVYQLK